jgi:putative transposase
LQEWRAAQVFERRWPAGLLTCDPLNGLAWAWPAMDGALTKAPLGGNQVGHNPTARGQLGTTRSVLPDGHGLPRGIAVDGAHRQAMPWVDAPLEAIIITRPEPPAPQPPHRCLDTGDDDEAVREPLAAWSSTAHLRHRGEEAPATRDVPGYRARRGVVERTHAWMKRLRRLLIRWENTVEHALAWRPVACAWITFRAAELFG